MVVTNTLTSSRKKLMAVAPRRLVDRTSLPDQCRRDEDLGNVNFFVFLHAVEGGGEELGFSHLSSGGS
jgi:hypothetical protein